MADITVNSQIVIHNGSKIEFNRTFSGEAFDKIDVTVPPDTTDAPRPSNCSSRFRVSVMPPGPFSGCQKFTICQTEGRLALSLSNSIQGGRHV